MSESMRVHVCVCVCVCMCMCVCVRPSINVCTCVITITCVHTCVWMCACIQQSYFLSYHSFDSRFWVRSRWLALMHNRWNSQRSESGLSFSGASVRTGALLIKAEDIFTVPQTKPCAGILWGVDGERAKPQCYTLFLLKRLIDSSAGIFQH